MRQYNEHAPEGEDLRFYGFDMQRISYSIKFLTEACEELGVNTTNLQKLARRAKIGAVNTIRLLELQYFHR